MTKAKSYFKSADEAQSAGQAEFYRSGIYHDGLIGGEDCPPDYRGDGRPQWTYIPTDQQSSQLSGISRLLDFDD